MKELNEFVCDPKVRKSNINTILYVAAIVLGLVVLAAIPKQPGDQSANGLPAWSENRIAPVAAADSQAADVVTNPELRSVERARARQFVAGAASGLYVNPELKVLSYAVPAVEADLYRNPELKVLSHAVPTVEADLYRNPELKVLSYSVPAVEVDLHRNPELKALDRTVVIRQPREPEVRIPGSGR